MINAKKRLGDMLLDAGLVNEDQLKKALLAQKLSNERLGVIFKKMGYISEETLIEFLSKQLKIPILNLKTETPKKELAQYVTAKTAEENKLAPVKLENNILTIAMADPLNVFVIDEIHSHTNLEIEIGVAAEADIMEWVNVIYHSKSETISDMEFSDIDENQLLQNNKIVTAIDSPIVKLVNDIITQSVRKGASDVHFDSQKNGLKIRYRIDGIMSEVSTPHEKFKPLITSRLKILANLDIAEKRIPQDGRISISIDGRDIDIRVSTLPTIHGERIVLRILDKSNLLRGVNDLGFSKLALSRYNQIIHKPQGIVLVVGPTGSGKTSTLYASLLELNNGSKNIITVEDPVEYELQNINQVAVNPKTGLTFASGLRSILRQDPDVIMIGEIRDKETAQIAIQASLTGHLVFSTLHTLDAASTFTRLVNMEIEPYLIATSVDCVIAQRLVRRICSKCKRKIKKDEAMEQMLTMLGIHQSNLELYEGEGCDHCNHTGYKGRIAIFEIILTNDAIRAEIIKKADSHIIKQQAKNFGTLTLREDGFRLVREGITTLAEVIRVTEEEV